MARLGGTYRSSNGVVIPSPTVTVYRAGTSTLARLYTTSALSTLASNPFAGVGDGTWSTFVHGGSYDITLTAPGYDTVTYTDVGVFDPNDAYEDVRQYGAVCDDTADDTAAINAAIAALPATGGAVLIPGPCKITAPIKDQGKDNVTLFSFGGGKIRGVTNFQTLITINARSGWTIRDLYLYGPGNGRRVTTDQEGCGVQLITCTYCTVYNCRIENCGKYDGIDPGIAGVYLRGSCKYCRIENNSFSECNCAVNEDAFGTNNDGPIGNQAIGNTSKNARAHFICDNRAPVGGIVGTGMEIIGNQIEGHIADVSTEHIGIRVYDSPGTVVVGNRMRAVGSGIEIMADSNDCTVSGNVITTMVAGAIGGHGIWVRNDPVATTRLPRNCAIGGNSVSGAINHGIFLDVTEHTVAEGNAIRTAGADGIRIGYRLNSAVGNRVYSPVGHGIYVTGATGGSVLLSGNVLHGDDADTGLTDDGIRVDCAGGPVTIVGNVIENDQTTAGWKYGINQSSGSVVIQHSANKIFRAGTAPINPSTLAEVQSYGDGTFSSVNEATRTRGKISELITLSTAGTTTDSVANLLPANSVIEAVVARVTTTIATATDWKLGDATTSGRFSAASTGLAAGSTVVGTVHEDQTGAAGPRQAAAAKLRITTTGTPSAGAIRVTVFYRSYSAPTS